MPRSRPTLLARYLALAWCGLLIYGSLHPFSGWRDTGSSPFAFLEGGWPRYWTSFDLLTNVAVYLPLGFFLAVAFAALPGRWTGLLLATLGGGLLSCGLESLQTWLPARVPSNLDLAANTLGTLLGALLARSGGRRIFPLLTSLQQKLLNASPQTDLGLTLLGLWLLVPLSPEILLFGAGDLRHLLDLPPAVPFAAHSFQVIEAAIIGLNTVAVGLLVRQLAIGTGTAYLLVPGCLLLGLSIRSLAATILIGPEHVFSWLTPGAEQGLAVGAGVLALSLFLPATLRMMLAAVALMAASVLVNLAPPNPYSAAALAAWRQGHFLNFNGLTRLVAAIWPFLTLPYIILAGRQGNGRSSGL